MFVSEAKPCDILQFASARACEQIRPDMTFSHRRHNQYAVVGAYLLVDGIEEAVERDWPVSSHLQVAGSCCAGTGSLRCRSGRGVPRSEGHVESVRRRHVRLRHEQAKKSNSS